jgi:hypothetical protein
LDANRIQATAYFLTIASSFFRVSAGHKFGAVNIAFFKAEAQLQPRSFSLSRLTASFIMS